MILNQKQKNMLNKYVKDFKSLEKFQQMVDKDKEDNGSFYQQVDVRRNLEEVKALVEFGKGLQEILVMDNIPADVLLAFVDVLQKMPEKEKTNMNRKQRRTKKGKEMVKKLEEERKILSHFKKEIDNNDEVADENIVREIEEVMYLDKESLEEKLKSYDVDSKEYSLIYNKLYHKFLQEHGQEMEEMLKDIESKTANEDK